mgnify:FL=1
MKRRLLFLFAVFMVATSVGWGQTDLYVSTSGSDGNGGGVEAPLATIAKAIEKAADGATIRVAEGIYPQVSPIVIPKSITIIGSDSTNCIIEGQLDIQRDEEESVINVNLRNLQITKATTLSQGLINVMSKNVNLNLSGVHLHQLTAGSGDGWGKSSMGIVNLGKSYDSNSICDNVNVSLTNSCIYLEGSYNRGFSSFGNTTKVKNTIVLDNSHILSAVYPKNGTYSRGISFSNMNGSSIEMKNNSTIKGFYYAINVTALNDNLSISIVDSKIDSWAALNIWSSNNKFKIANSTLESHNYQLKGSNDFATIVLNKDEEDNAINNSFDIKNTNLFAFMESTALQYPISVRSTGNTFNIGEGSVLKVNKNNVGVLIQDYKTNTFNCDNTVKYQIADEKSAITVFNQDGSLRNAACDMSGLLSEVDLTDQNRIVFPEGEYTLPMTLPLDKSITIQGAGQDKTIIKGAILVNGSANNTATDVKIKGLSIDYTPTKVTSGKCTPIIEVTGNADLLIDNCIMNNNTQGYGDRKNPNPAEALQNAILLGATAKGTVRVENTTINLAANAQSGVLIDGELTDVSLVNTKIEGQVNGSNQFGVYIHHKKTPVTVDSTTILLNNHYCIYANNAGDQKLTIKNKSNIVGYGALYLYETSDMNVHVSGGSILTGKTKNKGVSDSFAAIAISTNNSTVGASNNEIVIEDSYIGNKFAEQETMAMTPIKINGSFTPIPCDNKIILKGKTIVSTTDNIKNPTIVGYGMNPDKYNNVIMLEGTDVQLQDQNGKPCVIINKPDGSFRNAAVSIVTAIDFGELYGSTYYHEGIAYAGDIIMIPDTTIAETLDALNAAEYTFFKAPTVPSDQGTTPAIWEPYVIPDSVIFDCKDGCLVAKESAAKTYAIANPYKRVYWLNQGEKSFSIKDYAVAIEIKNDTTWATPYSERKVNVLDGATLTLSTPMVLDTVTMEEGAQLRSALTDVNQKVTAKVLRFAPKLSGNNWKALGVPFTSLEVKDSKGASVSAPSAQEADNGIWFADLKNNKTPIFEVKTDNFGAAGLWAANGDTYTISSEGAFEFKTLEEPAAPTETGTFLMCSNPNTFTITLKQSAYILTTDGTSFEQEANPEIKPFQSFVLTDAKTLSTLRSLRIGDGGQPDDRAGRWLLRDYRSWRYRDSHAGAYGRGGYQNEWQGRLSWRGYGRTADHGFFGHLCRERSISKG